MFQSSPSQDSRAVSFFSSRRRLLQGMLAAGVVAATGIPFSGADPAKSISAGLQNFASISEFLTQDNQLSGAATNRLYQAFKKLDNSFDQQLSGLDAGLRSGHLTEDQNRLAQNIMAAWYLGTVNGQVVLYEEALMFRVVQHGIGERLVRSYVPDAPEFWSSKPSAQTVTTGTVGVSG